MRTQDNHAQPMLSLLTKSQWHVIKTINMILQWISHRGHIKNADDSFSSRNKVVRLIVRYRSTRQTESGIMVDDCRVRMYFASFWSDIFAFEWFSGFAGRTVRYFLACGSRGNDLWTNRSIASYQRSNQMVNPSHIQSYVCITILGSLFRIVQKSKWTRTLFSINHNLCTPIYIVEKLRLYQIYRNLFERNLSYDHVHRKQHDDDERFEYIAWISPELIKQSFTRIISLCFNEVWNILAGHYRAQSGARVRSILTRTDFKI